MILRSGRAFHHSVAQGGAGTAIDVVHAEDATQEGHGDAGAHVFPDEGDVGDAGGYGTFIDSGHSPATGVDVLPVEGIVHLLGHFAVISCDVVDEGGDPAVAVARAGCGLVLVDGGPELVVLAIAGCLQSQFVRDWEQVLEVALQAAEEATHALHSFVQEGPVARLSEHADARDAAHGVRAVVVVRTCRVHEGYQACDLRFLCVHGEREEHVVDDLAGNHLAHGRVEHADGLVPGAVRVSSSQAVVANAHDLDLVAGGEHVTEAIGVALDQLGHLGHDQVHQDLGAQGQGVVVGEALVHGLEEQVRRGASDRSVASETQEVLATGVLDLVAGQDGLDEASDRSQSAGDGLFLHRSTRSSSSPVRTGDIQHDFSRDREIFAVPGCGQCSCAHVVLKQGFCLGTQD